MTVASLFGPEQGTSPRTIRLKQIRAVYETLTISEHTNNYLPLSTTYTSPQQIFETFSFLKDETKEYFLSLHLDGKNRAHARALAAPDALCFIERYLTVPGCYGTGEAPRLMTHTTVGALPFVDPRQV